ncbi:MAG: DNA starvation/stationary phase protection protein [Scytolyngbya sp. HA4215-MV1]|jgi:starvation-inducible DNA-binding protein|nr:DNA starvation/stationary phase protection protein [Scytolyngbya sp. HA4215-MV1]
MATNASNQVATKATSKSAAVSKSDQPNRVKSFPAPKQLATPTDLKPEEVQAVVEAVNPLVADSFALYVKTKNYHWHLASSHFRDYHLMLDEQAESIFDSIDPLAERIRRIGGTTIRSITHISQLQGIVDDNDDFVLPEEMIQNLIDDNRHMAEKQRVAIEITEENRDTPTSNLLQEILDETEKRIWFLYEVSQGGHNME